MKKTRLFVSLLALPLAVGLSACNWQKTVNDATNWGMNSLQVDSDGHFRGEKKYHFNGTNRSYDFTFTTDGKLNVKNLGTNSTTESSYKVMYNIIEVTSGDDLYFMDYCEDIIYKPEYLDYNGRLVYTGGIVGVLDGVAASQNTKTAVGYHIELSVRQGDIISVFNGEKGSSKEGVATSKGYTYRIYKNGTVDEDPNAYINADQFGSDQFSSEEVGQKVVDLNIGQKTYKAVLRVAPKEDISDDAAGVNLFGWFKYSKLFRFKDKNNNLGFKFLTTGTVIESNYDTEEDETHTYKVDGNIITIDKNDNTTMYVDYYTDFIFVPVFENGAYKTGNAYALEGKSISTKIKEEVGYHFEINVQVGDAPSVLTGKSSSKGYGYKIYSTGATTTSKTYLNQSNLKDDSQWITTSAGDRLIDLTINDKDFKAVLRVSAAAE